MVASAGAVPAYSRSNDACSATDVSVYSDGRVIAYAGYEARLSETALTELVTALTADLASQPASPTPDADTEVIGSATAVMSIRLGREGPRFGRITVMTWYERRLALRHHIYDPA